MKFFGICLILYLITDLMSYFLFEPQVHSSRAQRVANVGHFITLVEIRGYPTGIWWFLNNLVDVQVLSVNDQTRDLAV